MNRNFCFGFTSPDDRLPIGKSGYAYILNHPPPRHQPPHFLATAITMHTLAPRHLTHSN
jgi:hypothetical protein